MSLSGKEKKRGPNWTIEERNTLIELCRASTNTLKMNWGEVADRVNSIGGNSRVAPEVKKKWTDMKSNVKRKAQQERTESRQTGNGLKTINLDSWEEMVLTTIPKVSVDGIPGGVQCGVSSNQESNKEEEEEEEEEEKDMIQGAAANVKDRSSSVKFSSCNATGGSTSNLQLRMVMAQEQQNSILSSIDSTLKKMLEYQKEKSVDLLHFEY
ncbi:nuclear apoptosis-inducing factor 1-like isoform X2 [Mya arenaria]|uniref:nuclear apoptosis-inducing factor 1-like n=1 Tax=Mya arenaria TaxID=6604 RepID=UPI0022E7024F|nr:nuclear apoptosis-inducing factor 1-like [Mya arenaria]XP_052788295.1 nuclear apoptosis-inducing factor 1-like isoform X2 [Mya arenaria]